MNSHQILLAIAEVREANRKAREAQNKVYDIASVVAKLINEKICKPFGFELLSPNYLLMGGCATPTWNPEVAIDTSICIDHPKGKEGQIRYVYLGEGRFEWVNTSYSKVYPHHILSREEAPPAPYDGVALLKLCEEVTEELGIPVTLRVCNITPVNTEEHPQDEEDVLARHPGGKILASGDISYHGWDCTDKWVIVGCDDGKHLYYGLSGHGFGMTEHIKPGEDLKNFFSQHRDNDTQIDGIEEAREILNYSKS